MRLDTPVKLNKAQLRTIGKDVCYTPATEGFRVHMGGVYYFLKTQHRGIVVAQFSHDNKKYVRSEAALAVCCLDRFFNVVVPHMKKLGWYQ